MSRPAQTLSENPTIGWYCFGVTMLLIRDKNGTQSGHNNNTISNKEEIKKKTGKTIDTPTNNQFRLEHKEEFSNLKLCREIQGRQILKKQKNNCPYFPAKEIDKIISDISYCTDRPDKIFIHHLWNLLLPFFVMDVKDEKGENSETQQDPEGMPFYADRMIPDIIKPALEKTRETVSGLTKKPSTLPDLTPEDVARIVDFTLTTYQGERVYIISKKKFRNINGKELPVTGAKPTRQTREEDYRYMQNIILAGDDDKRYKKLTPVEEVIYNFLLEYFEINPDGSIKQPRQAYLNRQALDRFYLSIASCGLTPPDFLSLLHNNAPRKDGSLRLKNRMFDSSRVKNLNAKLGFTQKIP